MHDAGDEVDADRAYRVALQVVADAADRAPVLRRRRAVLDAVRAARTAGRASAAVDTAPSAPAATERLASNETLWRQPAAWWRGAAAACVLVSSTLLVVHLQEEPVSGAAPSARGAADVAPAPATPPPQMASLEPRAATPAPVVADASAKAQAQAQAQAPQARRPGAATMPTTPPPVAQMPEATTAHAPPAAAMPAVAAAPMAAARGLTSSPPVVAAVDAQARAAASADAAQLSRLSSRREISERRADMARPPPGPLAQPLPAETLLAAAAAGDTAALERLLANPDAVRDADGRTALSLAVLRKDAGLVRLLRQRGASLLLPDRFGQTPQGYAQAGGDSAVLQALALP